ncbi:MULTISPECIES: GNAT family N-acetyltransferase [unclassified Ruminococcus]|uniref:GNAT family N-acetyltransferase n=1 Tax=unclassified Ruminococcus TaxID=2608920 RepID=UPI00210C5879|nr:MULTISPECIES: N-acetyltransferase [unclassified Ruminococcus]MCQ4023261.1 GNAT family N-acetyltransferase [Ruminococcus sp. zg-924]MCQ4115046.1 GNAT family N-acetyltransferase [Ruminococcus sp. zg-921]
MSRIIRSVYGQEDLKNSLELVETVFTESEGEESGKIVRSLVEEIRSKQFYLPELELIMVDEKDDILGYAMFSRFHLEGKYENELLLLSPVAVKTELQRQHISKEIIEFGFQRAVEMGFKAVIVEGNPQNYRARGFRTSHDFGIVAGKTLSLPFPECLMVKELVEGALLNISGIVEYSDYQYLT